MPTGIDNRFLPHRPVLGGVAIHNENAGKLGTLGFVATSDSADRWIVSCYHVLCRFDGTLPADAQEPIFQPLRARDRTPIAMITSEKLNKDLDCAAARVPDGNAIGRILGIGKLGEPVKASIGQRVIKSGMETGITEGVVTHISDERIVVGCMGFPSGYELSNEGDSGALWIDAESHAPVAMHFGGNVRGSEQAFGRPIATVLDALQLKFVVE